MDMVLQAVLVLDLGLPDFEDKVFAGVEQDPELSIHAEDTNAPDRPAILARRIFELLQSGLPAHVRAMADISSENGRPSRLTRYWLLLSPSSSRRQPSSGSPSTVNRTL